MLLLSSSGAVVNFGGAMLSLGEVAAVLWLVEEKHKYFDQS
jgi:hypothetical protein